MSVYTKYKIGTAACLVRSASSREMERSVRPNWPWALNIPALPLPGNVEGDPPPFGFDFQNFPRKLPIIRYFVRYRNTTAPRIHDPGGGGN